MAKKIHSRCILIWLFAGLAACSKNADELKAGIKAYYQKDYSRARQIFERNQKDATAQLYLAKMYRYGSDVPKDTAEAASLYRQAADKGSQDASYAYGEMLVTGNGVTRDADLGLKYLETAGTNGEPQAFVTAGDYYLSLKTPTSSAMALAEYKKGGTNVFAQTAIARLYESGAPGVPENPVLARLALETAIAHPDKQYTHVINRAIVNLAEYYFLGYGVAQSNEKAVALLETTGDPRYGRSMRVWFTSHATGHTISDEAVSVWLKEVRENPRLNSYGADTDYARVGLAVAYANGFGVEKSRADSDFYLAPISVSLFGGRYLVSMLRAAKLLPGGCEPQAPAYRMAVKPDGRYRSTQAYAWLTKAICLANESKFESAYYSARISASLGYPGAADYAQSLSVKLSPSRRIVTDYLVSQG